MTARERDSDPPHACLPAGGRHTACGAAGLGYLHRLGLTHGNLRPSNMLVPPAEALTVLVHDFLHVLLANNHAACWCHQLK